MKDPNNNMIPNWSPFGMTMHRRANARRIINYNDRSPETRAMTAHLRAAAYRDRKAVHSAENPAKSPLQQARGFLNLGREYDNQARDNFAKEAVLFGVILVVAMAWPAILSLKALAG